MLKDSIFQLQSANGVIALYPYCNRLHGSMIYQWIQQPYAHYWGMSDQSREEVERFYEDLMSNKHHSAYVGYLNERPAFLIEVYDPEHDPVGKCYDVQTGDTGMHVLMAPPKQTIANFTTNMMRFIMSFLFSQEGTKRVVVEPDVNNEKIHVLNKKVGFHHLKQIKIGKKDALLGFCTRAQFLASGIHADSLQNTHPERASEAIQPDIWQRATRTHMAKVIGEFSHERIFSPKPTGNPKEYTIESPEFSVRYTFKSECLKLEHWAVEQDSIKKTVNGNDAPLDSLNFILEFNHILNVPQAKLPVYLEEISSTLYGAAYKLMKKPETAAFVANADFQFIEQAMTEGHPGFVANNGRIGFDANDYPQFAPEAGNIINLIWLAAHKDRAHFAHCDDINYKDLIEKELDVTVRQRFLNVLKERNLDPNDYWFLPVHPWQWYNKLAQTFSSEIANEKLVCLGYGESSYQAQQSIRTFFNRSNPDNFYVKTAISVLNMGFMRGLSSYYMRTTPAINTWLKNLLDGDDYIQSKHFKIIREIATIGYQNPYFEHESMGNTPYKKMLAALWRESPLNLIEDNQRLMTMAALLHRDQYGDSLVSVLIKQSKLSPAKWLSAYLDAYLSPLLHCYFAYDLVYMPHGENLILVLENDAVHSVIMKDLAEEIALLNSTEELSEDASRVKVTVPESHELLFLFTDIFDGFFRFLASILHVDGVLKEDDFWSLVADCVTTYQKEHPQFAKKYQQHDLFKASFHHSCLNRLQLANNDQMIALDDPSELLQIQGEIDNPIHPFKKS